MRKNFALVMIAMLSLTFALSAMSCAKKAEETTSGTTETTPPAETMPMDTTNMMHDSTMADTSMHQ